MKQILVIGIGAGNPDYMTVQAINALNTVDVFFVLDKGEAAGELVDLRDEICRRFITHENYRTVRVPQPERDRASSDYKAGVDAWHADKAQVFETLIRDELADGQCGAFLVWGDPAFYDSTIRILQQILARGVPAFAYQVIPGISAMQALAAGHRIPLNRIGEPVMVTTGRRVASGFEEDSVVLLDSGAGLRALRQEEGHIFWGAYLGTPDEVLIHGRLKDVADEILRLREDLRRRKGWIMDTYLLRRDAE
ncbi:precorrin-6A synthase (deacetylating) [Microvirga antarctica]|uniref:precorrin-6A synthase (deacetylating) n=1 Tax=Microvirga antarctica TaxID=2819233 RepID=UPI001B30D1DA|nr:precorrin-6A synthase (deacetylating) [Microvirga antarctica]